MKSAFILASALVLLMIVSAVPVSAEEFEYGFVNAWFNGQNATVHNVTLKIGEPAEVRVEIISKINGNVYVKLKEPGITKSFEVLSGPSKNDEWLYNYDVTNGWSKSYTWTIAPNGNWKDGSAPLNLIVSFSEKGDQKSIEFTIANPYILDEQYSGSAAPSQTSGATETPKTDSAQNAAPFPYIYLVLIVVAAIVVLVLFKMRRKV